MRPGPWPVRERNPLLSKSERGILYYPSPREESFTIQVRERNPLLSKSERGIFYYPSPRERPRGAHPGPWPVFVLNVLCISIVSMVDYVFNVYYTCITIL